MRLSEAVETQPRIQIRVSSGKGAPGNDGDPGPTGPAGDLAKAVGRSAMSAIAGPSTNAVRNLVEGGRSGLFTFVEGDLSAMVTADPLQAVFVAPDSDATGVSGAWVRQYDGGGVWAEWFGAVGDDVTDDGPAFAAALLFLAATSDAYSGPYYRGTGKLNVGAKQYFLNATTLDLFATTVIEGQGSGQDGGYPSRLRWAAGTTGIRVQRYNTSGAGTLDDVTHRGGDGSIIRGLLLEGAWDTVVGEAEAHGIQLRARATIEDCYIYRFQGDGVSIGASSPNGNANCFMLNRVSVVGNRTGVAVGVNGGSADVNAGVGIAINASGNRRWGIDDSSFLGNNWYGCHASDNGLVGGTTPTVCSNGTYRYSVRNGQAANASTTAPSGDTTDNAVWLYNGSGDYSIANNIPLWANGTVFRTGGCYRTNDANNSARFDGCYSEGGQGLAQYAGQTLSTGGNAEVNGVHLKSSGGNLVTNNPLTLGGTLYVGGMSTMKDTLTLDGYGSFKSRIILKYSANNVGSLYFTNLGFSIEGYENGVGYQPVSVLGSNFQFWANSAVLVVDMDTTGLKLGAGKVLKVGGTQVVAAQQAAVADDASGAANQATVNAILAAMRAHGLIAS